MKAKKISRSRIVFIILLSHCFFFNTRSYVIEKNPILFENGIYYDCPITSVETRSTDINGNLTYVYSWNETANNKIRGYNELGFDVAIDSNDNCYALGIKDFGGSNPKLYYEKYDPNGVSEWNYTNTLIAQPLNCKMIINQYNEIYISGYYYDQFDNPSLRNKNIFLVKLVEDGTTAWTRTWGLESSDDYGEGVCFDNVGNPYIIGYTAAYTTYHAALVIKYNRDGTFQWYKIWGGTTVQKAYSGEFDANNNLLFSGERYDGTSTTNPFIIKCDSSGNEIWNRYLTNSSDDIDYSSIKLDNQNNVYAGFDHYDINSSLYKYDSSGNFQWFRNYHSTEIYDIDIDSSQNLIILGRGKLGGESFSFKLVKIDNNGRILQDGGLEQWPNTPIPTLSIDSNNSLYTIGWYGFAYEDDVQTLCVVKFIVDSDGDNISNMDEIYTYQTNPNDVDTDGDLINDYYEIFGGFSGYSHPTNPNEVDSDGDNIDDYTEIKSLDNPFGSSTDPNDPDTDNDGLLDNEECFGLRNSNYGNEPTNPNQKDTDNDNLNDTAEIEIYNTDPNDRDTDDDSYSDGWEIENNYDPLDKDDFPQTYEEKEKYDDDNEDSEGENDSLAFDPATLLSFSVLSLAGIGIVSTIALISRKKKRPDRIDKYYDKYFEEIDKEGEVDYHEEENYFENNDLDNEQISLEPDLEEFNVWICPVCGKKVMKELPICSECGFYNK